MSSIELKDFGEIKTEKGISTTVKEGVRWEGLEK